MKRKKIWLAAGIGLWLGIVLPARAQIFTTRHDFTNSPDGANPRQLAGTNGFFYGTTVGGGTNGVGTIFQFNASGPAFTTIYQFTGATNNGSSPNNLLLAGNMIFGTTTFGGTNSLGMVFAASTNGANFTPLYSFGAAPDGSYPVAGLVLGGATLYGTAYTGGTNGGGTVFKINTDGTGYSILHWFTNAPDGFSPQSELVLGGGALYGTTAYGGSNYGTIFAIGTNGGGYTILHNFTNTPDGSYPFGGLTLSGGVLYGTTISGGVNTNGVIFSINPDGSGYKVLYSFGGFTGNTDGEFPKGALAVNGSLLYGTASSGGSGGGGTLFLMNTNGTGFTVIKSFSYDPASGNDLENGAIRIGNTLWGTTFSGGTGGYGILYSSLLSPQIISQPQSLTVTNGYPAAFTVSAADDTLTNYQWYFNTNTLLAGQTNGTLTLASVTTNNAGAYTVVVSDQFGSVTSSPASLTVIIPLPTITQPPQNYTVTNGYTASFTNVASGPGPLFYQWYFNTNTPVAGGTNAILLLTFAATNQAGFYTVVVTNTFGSATSSPARLTVISTAPIIFSQPQSLTVSNGDPVAFAVTAAGQNPLRYQWFTNSVSTTHALAGKTNSTLTYAAASNNLAGNYLVVITNSLGKATSNPALLTVITKPVITLQPQNVTVTNGNPATFIAGATGAGLLKFQWYFRTNTLLAGATNTTLNFTNAITNLAGAYRVIVTNVFGKATSSLATLTIVTKPNLLNFTFNPSNGSVSLALANVAKSTNRLWATTNLVSTNFWRVIATNVMATNGLWFFTDTNAAQTNKIRFYRLSTP
jgi:uncharacterized repeat protein (TIGR03803 family)